MLIYEAPERLHDTPVRSSPVRNLSFCGRTVHMQEHGIFKIMQLITTFPTSVLHVQVHACASLAVPPVAVIHMFVQDLETSCTNRESKIKHPATIRSNQRNMWLPNNTVYICALPVGVAQTARPHHSQEESVPAAYLNWTFYCLLEHMFSSLVISPPVIWCAVIERKGTYGRKH